MKSSTKHDPVALVMKQARKDPQFFHQLIFNPKKALSKATFLDRKSKARLLRVRPETVIASITGHLKGCPDAFTCVSGTCGNTCGGNSCIDTCIGSCTTTIVTDMIQIDPARLVSVQVARVIRRASGLSRTARTTPR